jgi:phosphoribosylformylglycinamidine synthase
VVTVHPEDKAAFEACLKGNVFSEVGKVVKGNVFKVLGLNGKVIVRANIFDLKKAWQRPLRF